METDDNISARITPLNMSSRENQAIICVVCVDCNQHEVAELHVVKIEPVYNQHLIEKLCFFWAGAFYIQVEILIGF